MKLTPEQLKGKIRAFAEKNHLRAQEVLQMVMFEQFLSKLEKSQYKDNFIVKGGILIASIIGVTSRTTMDLDTTIQGLNMNSTNIEKVIREIINIDLGDGITFVFDSISNIREEDQYENFRVHLIVQFGKMRIPMKIDITTGDIITPNAILYSYDRMFDDSPIQIKAYPLETILAEKYETIIRRNIATTRMRDFYDMYALLQMNENRIMMNVLKEAVVRTATERMSLELLNDWEEIIEDIRNENSLNSMWENYKEENPYVPDISYNEVVNNLFRFAQILNQK
ncbi:MULTISPECIES: nucleotidyl transferase AbiEii/AbiGii toxin family protein [unclassified Breznakia]|uniref:nucleotidyl transferase AbiEii/AbiGii toxin family protein n=1 Tax=unclassified Breznakia TaxID=2623764 RepID=UPI0024736E9F|nr:MULTISPECIES: nucleotidyl transferase AbiEii/AbiGii toxin family protein [unclassified Breznakia]MDH6367608.1 putative nucleotidyltransferase component of viral defense system [Breznakia sp. PH1-1]MDH6405305.1 putative nucleotidyltransferase component of viral defense system [Breznakia sp. PF1-11]MDH6412438.1 putative nucleotidyltransferase component of viral defense system [Breznakia sp. PFB1-11]MDH6415380.1 putative nucleotidyltransferase component of viral defense system [Breznakia sp. PF